MKTAIGIIFIPVVMLTGLAIWQNRTAEYWRKQYDEKLSRTEEITLPSGTLTNISSDASQGGTITSSTDHFIVGCKSKSCEPSFAAGGSWGPNIDVAKGKLLPNGSTTMRVGAEGINRPQFHLEDKPPHFPKPKGNAHSLVGWQDIRTITEQCHINPHRTDLVSEDGSWDIPIDCRRMLKQYGKSRK